MIKIIQQSLRFSRFLFKNTNHGERLRFFDYLMLFLLAVGVALFAKKYINFSQVPFEDAAILMRYADHFASGQGIVWNIGEKPVDGATDFLFMVVIGLVHKTGIPLEKIVRLICFVAHILTVWIVYLSARKLFVAKPLPAFITALYLAVGPGLYYVAAYFGTTFFALFASIAWYYALRIIFDKDTLSNALLFAFSALATGLIRPEGVFLVGFMLIAMLLIKGYKNSRYALFSFLVVFILLGGAYFLWRWNYFGHPLPLPFYKKGGGSLYARSFMISVFYTFRMCLPFLVVFLLGFYSRKTIRLTLSLLVPIFGFMSMFIFLSNEMNYGARFQYVLLPITLMCWWPLIVAFKQDFQSIKWNVFSVQKQIILSILLFIASYYLIHYQYMSSRVGYGKDGRYAVAMMLSEYEDKNYVMATSEAGLLPFYSKWNAIDTWGLNDTWITMNGGITEEYLDRYRPHMISFHASFSPVASYAHYEGEWYDMLVTLMNYADHNGYVLAAAFGDSPYQTHYYYVRSDFPDSEEIVSRIQSFDYIWYGSGRKSMNYACELPKNNGN